MTEGTNVFDVTKHERALARANAIPAELYNRLMDLLIHPYASTESLMVANEIKNVFGASVHKMLAREYDGGDDQPDVTLHWIDDDGAQRWVVTVGVTENTKPLHLYVNDECVAEGTAGRMVAGEGLLTEDDVAEENRRAVHITVENDSVTELKRWLSVWGLQVDDTGGAIEWSEPQGNGINPDHAGSVVTYTDDEAHARIVARAVYALARQGRLTLYDPSTSGIDSDGVAKTPITITGVRDYGEHVTEVARP
jgi:hypothetical protein